MNGLFPADWFKPMTRKPIVAARLAHYPSFSYELEKDQLSCGRHTDELAVIVLAQQDDVCGLQVKSSRYEWIDAKGGKARLHLLQKVFEV
jgi:isopenicillin N synthase-like dioxygenase